jgi:hypothetical protein
MQLSDQNHEKCPAQEADKRQKEKYGYLYIQSETKLRGLPA